MSILGIGLKLTNVILNKFNKHIVVYSFPPPNQFVLEIRC